MWAFDWYQNRWPWMILNGEMALILRDFLKKFANFRGILCKSRWQSHNYGFCFYLFWGRHVEPLGYVLWWCAARVDMTTTTGLIIIVVIKHHTLHHRRCSPRSQSAPSVGSLVPLSTVTQWLIYSSEGGGVHGGASRQRAGPNPAIRWGGVGPRH